MANQPTNNDEFLVLTDEEGNYYAIPRDLVERHRMSGEDRTRVNELLGEDDVEGFSMYQQLMNEYRTVSYQAERRQEAAQERLARSAQEEGESEAGQGVVREKQGSRLGAILTGAWRSLPFMRTASPNP